MTRPSGRAAFAHTRTHRMHLAGRARLSVSLVPMASQPRTGSRNGLAICIRVEHPVSANWWRRRGWSRPFREGSRSTSKAPPSRHLPPLRWFSCRMCDYSEPKLSAQKRACPPKRISPSDFATTHSELDVRANPTRVRQSCSADARSSLMPSPHVA